MYRCQTTDDYRPNKDIVPAVIAHACASYPNLDRLLEYASAGVSVELEQPLPRQVTRPANHGSATAHLPVLLRNLRAEQDAGRVLLLDLGILDLWPHIHVSPFGVVAKAGKDPSIAGRTIQDLSFPPGSSVNAYTAAASLIEPSYKPCAVIAKEVVHRVSFIDKDTYLLAGDVASAFRHVSLHSTSVHLFGGMVPELNLLVLDLSCPFGWSGSPSCYDLFGSAISHVHGLNAEPRGGPTFAYHWVDDHVCVTSSDRANQHAVELSLRRAMTTILGPHAINEAKFSGWHQQLKVLGLIFDTTSLTVSMPGDKIAKARALVSAAYHADSLTQSRFRSLLGSLRHVATCLRPARPFLQRLRSRESYSTRYRAIPISAPMREDLRWWWSILHEPILNSVPMAFFGALPPAEFTIEVDASDYGCCAIDTTRCRFLQHNYRPEELAAIAQFHADPSTTFDINYRELLTCVFAAFVWHRQWREASSSSLVHVHFRIDNTSAIAWQTRLCSPNRTAQDLVRLLGWFEARFSLRFSSSHIPGSENIRADAGSRIAQSERTRCRFAELSAAWQQDSAVLSDAQMLQLWQRICANTPLPNPPSPSTDAHSTGGPSGAL